jgi:hypothetical protein
MWGKDHNLDVSFMGDEDEPAYVLMNDIKGRLLEIDFYAEGDKIYIPSGKDPQSPSSVNWYLIATCGMENPKYFEILENGIKRVLEAELNHYCPQCMDEMEEEGTDAALQVHRCKNCADIYCWHFMKDTDPKGLCYICGSEKNTWREK